MNAGLQRKVLYTVCKVCTMLDGKIICSNWTVHKRMPDDRSLVILDVYHKAQQQFDYAVTGATGAVCTYILQTFKPHRIDIFPSTLELAALLVLIASVFFGFKLIEGKILVLQMNHQWLDEKAKLGLRVANLSKFPGVNTLSGEVLTAESVAREIPLLQQKTAHLQSQLDRWCKRCLRLYKWRNRCLAGGFLLLVLARLSTPYWQAPTQPFAAPIQHGTQK